MSCLLLSNENAKLEWILLCISSFLFVIVCAVFASGATVLLVAFSVATVASILGILANRRPTSKVHRAITVVISAAAALLFTAQLTLLVIAFPRILPYIYDNRLAPGPFVLGAIFSVVVVLFGLITTIILAIKHSTNSHQQINSSPPSRFIMLPVDPSPVRYT